MLGTEGGYRPAAEVASEMQSLGRGFPFRPSLCSRVLALRTCFCPRFVFRHPKQKGEPEVWSWPSSGSAAFACLVPLRRGRGAAVMQPRLCSERDHGWARASLVCCPASLGRAAMSWVLLGQCHAGVAQLPGGLPGWGYPTPGLGPWLWHRCTPLFGVRHGRRQLSVCRQRRNKNVLMLVILDSRGPAGEQACASKACSYNIICGLEKQTKPAVHFS